MKKHLFLTAFVMAALTLLWGCHHSSNNPEPDPEPEPKPGNSSSPWLSVTDIPEWNIDWNSNDSKPEWVDPDVSNYDSWMIIMIKVPDLIVPYITTDDIMAVFINNELRGLSNVATIVNREDEEEHTYFIVKAYGNAGTDMRELFSVRYYNSKLRQLFAVETEEMFIPEGDLGVKEDYVPPLLVGSSKYPIVMYWAVRFSIDQEQEEPLVPSPGDLVAAFVDGECRGFGVVGGSLFNGIIPITVYSKYEGEQLTLKYYSVIKKAIRVLDNVVNTKKGNAMTNVSI